MAKKSKKVSKAKQIELAKKIDLARKAYCRALVDVGQLVVAAGQGICGKGGTIAAPRLSSRSDAGIVTGSRKTKREAKKLTIKKMSETIAIPKRAGKVTCGGGRAKYCRETKRAAKFCAKKTYRTTALSGGRKVVTCESKKSGKRIVQSVLHPKNGKVCKAHGC